MNESTFGPIDEDNRPIDEGDSIYMQGWLYSLGAAHAFCNRLEKQEKPIRGERLYLLQGTTYLEILSDLRNDRDDMAGKIKGNIEGGPDGES